MLLFCCYINCSKVLFLLEFVWGKCFVWWSGLSPPLFETFMLLVRPRRNLTFKYNVIFTWRQRLLITHVLLGRHTYCHMLCVIWCTTLKKVCAFFSHNAGSDSNNGKGSMLIVTKRKQRRRMLMWVFNQLLLLLHTRHASAQFWALASTITMNMSCADHRPSSWMMTQADACVCPVLKNFVACWRIYAQPRLQTMGMMHFVEHFNPCQYGPLNGKHMTNNLVEIDIQPNNMGLSTANIRPIIWWKSIFSQRSRRLRVRNAYPPLSYTISCWVITKCQLSKEYHVPAIANLQIYPNIPSLIRVQPEKISSQAGEIIPCHLEIRAFTPKL